MRRSPICAASTAARQTASNGALYVCLGPWPCISETDLVVEHPLTLRSKPNTTDATNVFIIQSPAASLIQLSLVYYPSVCFSRKLGPTTKVEFEGLVPPNAAARRAAHGRRRSAEILEQVKSRLSRSSRLNPGRLATTPKIRRPTGIARLESKLAYAEWISF